VRKIYCVNRAVPTLPVNIEDAARSEAEIEEALKVSFHLFPELVIYFHFLADTFS